MDSNERERDVRSSIGLRDHLHGLEMTETETETDAHPPIHPPTPTHTHTILIFVCPRQCSWTPSVSDAASSKARMATMFLGFWRVTMWTFPCVRASLANSGLSPCLPVREIQMREMVS